MLINGSLHHAAGAVALNGMADLFGGCQAHAGLFAAGLEHIQHQRRVHIGLAAGIHAAKLAVAADGTIAHCSVASFSVKNRRTSLKAKFKIQYSKKTPT
jgi:hypothetical protein